MGSLLLDCLARCKPWPLCPHLGGACNLAQRFAVGRLMLRCLSGLLACARLRVCRCSLVWSIKMMVQTSSLDEASDPKKNCKHLKISTPRSGLDLQYVLRMFMHTQFSSLGLGCVVLLGKAHVYHDAPLDRTSLKCWMLPKTPAHATQQDKYDSHGIPMIPSW